ncbi:DUF1641 domain-containing protein [Sulfuracidifex metallicus]|uniref:DUF1641 domain-containing protein n=1 Tax=Sulfuracidifex metallicus DSM 6482 = JCM 9184 TaxID=523847 RepID=A0A6A9QPZ3_SULME|nr:DUF1641 domain-containing protein [Sulfuracidifex metallicus]MUN29828.1 DUF1641 domain-containing protein [Sulfuracidifex metallicus DSM 6482 = JCM 9184]WOE51786.1 DUF1641 domain-containing protein [Sulfuracidifex metallicus DSM 6482 = JCM 9184]
MSEQEQEKMIEFLKELEDSGVLDILTSLLKNKDGALLEIANWLQKNQNVMKNVSTLMAALSKVDPDQVKKSKSLIGLFKTLNDPDVLAGISFFLSLMKSIGETLRE